MDDAEAEKLARNDAVLRDANDEIAATAADYGLDDGRPIPFICECADPRCSTVISLTLAEYRRVRGNPRWFAHFPGHESDVPGAVRQVEQHDRYVLVEKVEHAGEIATRLANRGEA
jgi:hypothetical protein